MRPLDFREIDESCRLRYFGADQPELGTAHSAGQRRHLMLDISVQLRGSQLEARPDSQAAALNQAEFPLNRKVISQATAQGGDRKRPSRPHDIPSHE